VGHAIDTIADYCPLIFRLDQGVETPLDWTCLEPTHAAPNCLISLPKGQSMVFAIVLVTPSPGLR
jgi:hypothetical protein